MMEANLFGKCSGLPALHSRCDDCNVIDAARLHRHVAANLLEALSPEKLASSGNMLDADEAVVVYRFVLERRANQPESGILSKLAQQKRKVVWVKRDVCIHAADKVVVEILHFGVTSIKGMNFASKMPFLAFGRADQLNPSVFRRIFVYDFISAIG